MTHLPNHPKIYVSENFIFSIFFSFFFSKNFQIFLIWKMCHAENFWSSFKFSSSSLVLPGPPWEFFSSKISKILAPKAPKFFGIFQVFKLVPSITRTTLDIFQDQVGFSRFWPKSDQIFRIFGLGSWKLAVAARVWGIVDWAGAKLVLPGPDFLACF